MGTPATFLAYERFLDFIMERATPQIILDFQIPDSERQRVIALLDKQDDDTLTPEEVAELRQIQMVDRLLLALKAPLNGYLSTGIMRNDRKVQSIVSNKPIWHEDFDRLFTDDFCLDWLRAAYPLRFIVLIARDLLDITASPHAKCAVALLRSSSVAHC
jgi:hypothetical protein